MILVEKACCGCKEVKPLEAFTKNKNRPDGLQAYCKACHNEGMRRSYKKHKEKRDEANREWLRNNREQYDAYRRDYYQKNKVEIGEKNKRARFLREYGLTMEEHAAMVQAQDGMCLLACGREVQVVDHCHVTGKVRGLLCSPCNWMLGHAADSPEVLRNAADYIEASRMGAVA